MKAMVLAAGKGTRLFPLTGEIAKPMAPVADKPIIQHIFELLAEAQMDEVHVNVHHLADSILGTYGQETRVNGTKVTFSREERLTGTAGGVKGLANHFDDTFVVVMGDALTDVNLNKVVELHKEREALATMALVRVADTSQYGVVEVDPDRNIVGFQEKPDPEDAISTLANTGIYVLEPRALEYVPKDTFFDFANDVFPRFLENGERFVGYEGDFYWSDIGTLEAYRQAQYDVLSERVRVKIPGEQRGKESVWVGENAHIHSSVDLAGCTVVGRDTVIGRGATLRGTVAVGSDCWIRPNATIRRSILLPGASVGDGAHLEDCIVGHGYDVRPGETIRGGALIRGTP